MQRNMPRHAQSSNAISPGLQASQERMWKNKPSDVLASIHFESQGGRYLGLPSIIGKSKTEVFKYVKDWVIERLKSWKETVLNMAGKETWLTEIRHQNIVKLYGFCYNEKHSFLVCDHMERVANVLRREKDAKELDWSKRVNLAKGVAHALSYLHHNCVPPIIHRDTSSKNVLLNSEMEAHVPDFGTTSFLKPDSSNWTAVAGTFGYIAPGNFN